MFGIWSNKNFILCFSVPIFYASSTLLMDYQYCHVCSSLQVSVLQFLARANSHRRRTHILEIYVKRSRVILGSLYSCKSYCQS